MQTIFRATIEQDAHIIGMRRSGSDAATIELAVWSAQQSYPGMALVVYRIETTSVDRTGPNRQSVIVSRIPSYPLP